MDKEDYVVAQIVAESTNVLNKTNLLVVCNVDPIIPRFKNIHSTCRYTLNTIKLLRSIHFNIPCNWMS